MFPAVWRKGMEKLLKFTKSDSHREPEGERLLKQGMVSTENRWFPWGSAKAQGMLPMDKRRASRSLIALAQVFCQVG